MSANLTAPQFTNEDAAIAHVEASRWPHGEVNCPHCGSLNVHRMAGKTQAGYFLCNDCRDKFTCRTGTVMERSHIPVHKWLLAIHLMSICKNGMSAHELHRLLGVTYKSAWFLAHRIREAMNGNKAKPMGGPGGKVQADETYYGNTSKRSKSYRKGLKRKAAVVGLVDPDSGEARAFHMELGAGADVVREILVTNASRKSKLVSDESPLYGRVGKEFDGHDSVKHSAREYVRYEFKWHDGQPKTEKVHTNNVENYFGVFKRGMRGTYVHCGEQHLQRYLNEFSFRYSNRSGIGVSDIERAAIALKGIEGKRLTYRRPD
jgi:transposase-like protein